MQIDVTICKNPNNVKNIPLCKLVWILFYYEIWCEENIIIKIDAKDKLWLWKLMWRILNYENLCEGQIVIMQINVKNILIIEIFMWRIY
jgi:hypothetical protein